MSFPISASFVTTPLAALGDRLLDPPTGTTFSQEAYGTDPQWELDTDLAELSKDVYNGPGSGEIGEGEWTALDPADLREAGIYPEDLTDADSGFQAAVYADKYGRVVVAFAGTEVTSLEDWINNAQQSGGLDSAQYNQAIALANKVAVAYGSENVVFTGHSLGGGLATAASLATGSTAVTFNSAGVGPETLDQLGLSHSVASQTASDGQVRRYNVENDALTNAQEGSGLSNLIPGGGSPLPDALGYEITLENPNTFEDAFRAHGTDSVLAAIRSRDIKSQDDDNFFDRLGDLNLFPMGPSVEDLGETFVDFGKSLGGLLS